MFYGFLLSVSYHELQHITTTQSLHCTQPHKLSTAQHIHGCTHISMPISLSLSLSLSLCSSQYVYIPLSLCIWKWTQRGFMSDQEGPREAQERFKRAPKYLIALPKQHFGIIDPPAKHRSKQGNIAHWCTTHDSNACTGNPTEFVSSESFPQTRRQRHRCFVANCRLRAGPYRSAHEPVQVR